MADRYVIPAGGASNTTATWSTTSGGAGGASIPISGDNVIYDAAAGNLVWTGTQSFDNLICTGATATMSGSGTLSILGDTFLLVAGMGYTATGTVTFTGANAVGDITLTRAGKTSNQSYTLNGVGKVFKLADAHNLGTGTLVVTNGTLNSQGFDITCGTFNGANANTRVITLTGSDIFPTGSFTIAGAGLTFAPPDLIRFTRGSTSPTTSILAGNTGDAFNTVEISRAVTGAFTGFQISGGLDIAEIALVGVASGNFLSCLITLTDPTTIDKMSLPEGSGLLSSANGTQRTITTNTNEISFDGCMIRDIVISGGPAYATNSIDLGNNSGITFNNFGPNTHEIVGVTEDADGAVLPSQVVIAFKEDGGVMKEVSRATSDAVTAEYTLGTPDNDPEYLIVSYSAATQRADAMNEIEPTVP